MTGKPLLVAGFHLNICDRLYEWFSALVMLGIAACLALPGVVMSGAFGQLQDAGVSRSVFTFFFAMFGTLRVFALFANGNIPVYGPRVRSFCALFAAPVWAILAFSVLSDALRTGRISLGLPIYFCLMLAEIYSAWRATYDVGRR